MELFNTATRKPESIEDEEALKQAIVSGTHAYQSGTLIPVISPTGARGTVPAENISAAVQQGYKPITKTKQAVLDYVDENKGIAGAAKVALGQFADEALFGVPELVLDKTADPLEVAKKDALKKEWETVNDIAGVAGAVVNPFAGPGKAVQGASAALGKVTEKYIAKKLAVELGKDAATTAVKNYAKGIAAKAGAGVAEGLVYSAPLALTEAALGDPDEAAQHLMLGGAIGGIFGGASKVGGDLLKLGSTQVKKGAEFIEQQKLSNQALARKLAGLATDVPEDDILHYIQNMDRVNAAPDIETIKNKIDDIYIGANNEFISAKAAAEDAERVLQENYRVAKRDMATAKAPAIVDDISAALETQKQKIVDITDQADDVLAASGRTFKKSDVLGLIKKTGKDLGPLISEGDVKAAAALKSIYDRIESQYGDDVTSVEARDIMKKIRKDIDDFDRSSGEFGEVTANALRNVTESISSVLKGGGDVYASEYTGLMKEAQRLVKNQKEMIKYFGTPEKAVSSLNSIMSERGKLRESYLKDLAAETGYDFLPKLNEFKRTKGLLEETRRRDVSKELFPDLASQVEASKARLEAAQKKLEPISRLTPEATQNIIRNQGFKNASIEARKALEKASEYAGEDFATVIRDRQVLDSLAKERPIGSRRTNFFGMVGGSLGYLLGGPIGGAIGTSAGAGAGYALDKRGGLVLKSLIDGHKDKSGLLFVEKQMKKSAETLDKIPEMIKGMKIKGKSPDSILKSSLIRVMLNEQTEASKERRNINRSLDALEKFNERSAEILADAGKLQNAVRGYTEPLARGGAPEIASAMSQRMALAIQYLHSVSPKPPKPTNIFASSKKWRPSDFELSKFEQKLQVVDDPYSVLDELKSGTLTPSHMEALRNVYPAIAERITQKIIKHAYENPEDIDYSKRMKLSLALGVPLDDSMTPNSVRYYQQTFYGQDHTVEQPGEAQQGSGVTGNVNLAPQAMSPSQATELGAKV